MADDNEPLRSPASHHLQSVTPTTEDRNELISDHNKASFQHQNQADNPYTADQASHELTVSQRQRKKNDLKNMSSSYIERMRYGGVGKDQSDSDEDEANKKPLDPTMTPLTRKAAETDEKAKKVKKLGTCGTFLSLLKGFVCTAILYLPDTFRSAGWAFQIFSCLFSCSLTIFCAYLLIEVRKQIRLPSYTDIGEKLYGRKGKIAVNITLFFSQTGFCCGYVWFIVSNVHQILKVAIGDEQYDEWITASACLVVFTLLCWVRKIEIFASTHIFADCMILITLIYVIVCGGLTIRKRNENDEPGPEKVKPIVSSGWAVGFGWSIYSYEGIGIILPVQDVTKNPETYFRIVAAVIGFVGFVYVFFGTYCIQVWQTDIQPIITSNTDNQDISPRGLQYTIIILFCFNLLFSYPLVLYPAHIIVENTLYSGWPKSRKRQWTKNFTRTLLVVLTVVLTMSVKEKINKFFGLLGSFTCTPIAFTFPAMFHLKAVAKTKFWKWVDCTIIVMSLVFLAFTGVMNIITWNDP